LYHYPHPGEARIYKGLAEGISHTNLPYLLDIKSGDV
jgi:hypothetical protein